MNTEQIEYYQKGVEELTAAIAAGIHDVNEMNRATRNLIQMHIKLEEYDIAKTLLRKYFHFNRKDLLMAIANLCKHTDDTSLAEELIGDIRCYSYVWLEFCVEMQALYTQHEEFEKADTLAESIREVAFASIRPATKAFARSLEISGKLTDSYTIKNLYAELKRIQQGG